MAPPQRASGLDINQGTSPFSEFRWADFLRDRIERETIENDFDCALALAMSLARSCEAKALPGWLGSGSD